MRDNIEQFTPGIIMDFEDNEACAVALFTYLYQKGEIENSPDVLIEITHDINNLRGHEWLTGVDRNLETKKFFDYLKLPEFDDNFVFNHSISPSYYYKVASGGIELPKEPTLDELRTLMDENGHEILWDYPLEEINHVLENSDLFLVVVGSYEENGYSARIFECTEEMADDFYNNKYIKKSHEDSLDSKIHAASQKISNKDIENQHSVNKEEITI